MGYCDEARPGGIRQPAVSTIPFSVNWPAQSTWTERTFGFRSTQNHVVRVAWNYY